MIKCPDIEDIGDVGRFCIESYYPMVRKKCGEVEVVAKVRQAGGNDILIGEYKKGHPVAASVYPFSTFLSWEQGYYKSRLVEYNGSILYLINAGAGEQHRNHGYRTNSTKIQHHHYDITQSFESEAAYEQARVALSLHRTSVPDALSQLESGSVVGCALSDNFGLITTDKSPYIQIVRRSKVIGKVINGSPQLNKGMEHHFHAVSKLWR